MRILGRSARPWHCAAFLAVAVAAWMPLWPVALPLLRVDLLGDVLDARTSTLLLRSLWMSAASGLLALLLGWPSAVLASRSDAPGSTLFRTLLPLPLLLPPLMVAQAWFGLTGMSGPWAAVATFGFCFAPLPALLAVRALSRQSASAHEAALLIGPRLAWSEMLRTSFPAALGGAVLAAVFAIGDFAVPDYFATVGELFHVYASEIFGNSRTGGYQQGASASLPLVALGLAAVFMLVRLQESSGGPDHGAGRLAAPLRLGRARWPAALLLFAILAVLLLAPIGQMIYETGAQGPASTRTWSEVSANAFRDAVDAGRGDILRSLAYTGMAGLFTLLVAPLIAHWLLQRQGKKRARVVLALILLPLLVPSVALGFGAIVAFNRAALDSFYTSLFLPALLVAGRFLPIAVLLLMERMRQVPAAQEEAAELCGAPYLVRLFRYRLGPQRSALFLAAGLVVVFGIRELDFAILTHAANRSAAVRYYNALHFSRDNLVAALGLILALLLFLPVMLHAAFRTLMPTRR